MKFFRSLLGSTLLLGLYACGGGGDSPKPQHQIKGSVTGLAADGLVLSNGSESFTVSASSGSFAFTQAVTEGADYSVGIKSQPKGMNCVVSNGSGVMGAMDVVDVAIKCTAPHLLKGALSGLVSDGLVLANGADLLSIAAGSTTFVFASPIQEKAAYAVTIKTQPSGQGCTVDNGTGTMGSIDVDKVTVTCTTLRFALGGTVGNLTTNGLKITDGSETVSLAAGQTSFQFPTSRLYGTAYDVSVVQQPSGQNCAITKATGVVTADISSIALNCVAGLVSGAENLPSLLAPQAGSTAAVGNGLEGVYTDFFHDNLLIAADGTYVRENFGGGTSFGVVTKTSDTWTVQSGKNADEFGKTSPLVGSGTFTPFRKLTGTENKSSINYDYISANALAIEQRELTGRWLTNGGFDITIDQAGNFSGTTAGTIYGACNVSGSVTTADAGSKKNIFKVKLTASGGSACLMDTVHAYSGLGNVGFYSATDIAANGYKRMLVMSMANDNGAWFTAAPRKQ